MKQADKPAKKRKSKYDQLIKIDGDHTFEELLKMAANTPPPKKEKKKKSS